MNDTTRALLALAAGALLALICWPLSTAPQPLTRLASPLWTQGHTVVVHADAGETERVEDLARRAGAAVQTAPQGFEPAARSQAIEDEVLVTLPESALTHTDLSDATVVVVPEGSHAQAFAASLIGPRPAPPWLTLMVGLVMALAGMQVGRSRGGRLRATGLLGLLISVAALDMVVSLELAVAALALGWLASFVLPSRRVEATEEEDEAV